MNKEIEEMATTLSWNAEECKDNCEECKYDNDEIPCLAVLQAERLYKAGYRKIDEKEIRQKAFTAGYEQGKFDARYKTIWHKVADGDLPPEQEPYTEAKQYWCHFDDNSGYTLAYYNDYDKTFYDYCDDERPRTYKITGIDFWTELPTYEGEEQ